MKFGSIVAVSCVLLAGCSGGGDGSDSVAQLDSLSLQQIETRLNTLDAKIDIAPFTALSDLPSSGSVTYDGALAIGSLSDLENALAGPLQLTANFQNDSISGAAGKFVDPNNQAKAGQIRFSNGRIISVGGSAEFTANATGNVTLGNTNYDISTTANGEFLGANGSLIDGRFFNTATAPDGSQTLIIGAIMAEAK